MSNASRRFIQHHTTGRISGNALIPHTLEQVAERQSLQHAATNVYELATNIQAHHVLHAARSGGFYDADLVQVFLEVVPSFFQTFPSRAKVGLC